MLQICEITLTPNSDGNYQEVKSCQLSAIGSSSASGGSGAVAGVPAAAPIVVIVSVHFGSFGYYDDRELYTGLHEACAISRGHFLWLRSDLLLLSLRTGGCNAVSALL